MPTPVDQIGSRYRDIIDLAKSIRLIVKLFHLNIKIEKCLRFNQKNIYFFKKMR